jgi:hypothetical protein
MHKKSQQHQHSIHHSNQIKSNQQNKTNLTNHKTFINLSSIQIYCTMMNLSLLLVFAALVNAVTGNGIEEITPPTACTPPGTPPVELGTASNYVILAKAGISTVPNSSIYGDVGVAPIAGAPLTGFDMLLDPGGEWSAPPQIDGKAYAADYTSPTSLEIDHRGRRHGDRVHERRWAPQRGR